MKEMLYAIAIIMALTLVIVDPETAAFALAVFSSLGGAVYALYAKL